MKQLPHDTEDRYAPKRVRQMLRGHVLTQIVASAVRFKIFDHLADGAASADRLSSLTGIGVNELQRFLRALEGLDLLQAAGAGAYEATPLGKLLRRDGLAHGNALLSGGHYYAAWQALDHCLLTGQSGFQRELGVSLWDMFSSDPTVSEAFSRTMRANTAPVVEELLQVYEFPPDGIVADLGAGDGTLLGVLLQRFPAMRGIAVEQASVVPFLSASIEEYGVGSRCEVVSGNLLDGAPSGADLYVLKSVVHNWDDAQALQMLRKCTDPLGERGRLLLIERAMDLQNPDKLGSAVLDLTMLVLFGAHDRTADEYRQLLELAGLKVSAPLWTPSGVLLLEAMKQ